MTFTLLAVALPDGADEEEARTRAGRCGAPDHPRGDLDPRIVAFHEHLRGVHPDTGSLDDTSPWASTPLDAGIDHVRLVFRHGQVSDPAIDLVLELAARYGLAVYDPQGDDVVLPPRSTV